MKKTLLDEFAMAALVAINPVMRRLKIKGPKATAFFAYQYAEAMLAEKLKREAMGDIPKKDS